MHDGIDVPIFDGRTDKTSGSPVNLVSAWLDGSAIYGMSAEHENLLRSWQNGTLKACNRKGLRLTLKVPLRKKQEASLEKQNHVLATYQVQIKQGL